MDTELVKGGETRAEGSSKRAREEPESENLKRQKLDENVEAEVDNDQEEAAMKIYMKIVPNEEVEIDAIPLATKSLIIVEWKIIKEGKISKFDGNADEGFFIGYSLNIKSFRVFNNRTRILEENLHIRFSESTPNGVGSGPNWLFDIDSLTRTMNYKPIVAGTQSNSFTDPKSYHDDGSKPSSDHEKKVDEDPSKESNCNDQEIEDNVNSINNINTVSSTVNVVGTNKVNADGEIINNELLFDQKMSALEDVGIFNFSSDDEDDGAMADMNNLKKDGIFISQDKYVAENLKKFRFTEVKTASTPMETQKPLLKDEDGEEVDVHVYMSMIGSLMIFRYLKGQPKLGLWYSKDSPFDLIAYTDSDYAEPSLDRKSTTRGKAKKSVRLMMEKLYKMDLELILVTAVAKTINEEVQLHALVDGKEIVITESSVRRDLQLVDVEGIVFQEPGKSTTTTTISSQPSQDKGKGIMTEEHVKPKNKDHIRLDEEAALKLQAKFDKKERLAKEKVKKEEEANIAFISLKKSNNNVVSPKDVISLLFNVSLECINFTKPTQTRTSQFPYDYRKSNKRVSFSTGVIPTTIVSRPQLKSNPMEDRVMLNNSQGKKQEVEDHRRNVKFSKNKMSVTECNDRLNAKTLNVNFVFDTCGKCVLNEMHDMCVLKSRNGVNSRTKMPIAMPVREPKRTVTQSVAKPIRKIAASDPLTRNLETPLGSHMSVLLVEIILFIVDSGCSKHMTGNLKLLINFVEKFLGTVKFRNDQIAPIFGYGDLFQRAVTIKRVYYIEGLNHNLFFVGQSCDADLEVAFRKPTCYICDLKRNDLLTGSRGTDLYSITLQDTTSPNLIFLMAKATLSQEWLWHRHLSHLNFDTINLLSKNDIVVGLPKLKFVKDHLCSSCELGKAKRKSFQTKITPSSKRLYIFYTWTYVVLYGSKDETPKVLIDFLRLVQRGLQAQVRIVRTEKGTEFLNRTLHAYFATEGILHQTSVARTPEQNSVVERRNRTLVEAARTMLSTAKVPLFFWAEAIATTCFTQNRSLVIPRLEKTPYHIINDRKPSVKFFHIFGSLCYIVRDGENLDKIKEKGDACIFVGYSTQSRAYRVFNKRTRVIAETIHVNFDELSQMASDHVVLKSSAVTIADAPNQRQQHITPLNNHSTIDPTCQVLTQAPTVTSTENKNQAEMITENAQVADDEFINIFCTPTKDHSLEKVIGNPSQSVRTRRQLESDGKMCMFALTVSQTEPKNIKEAMADSAWIESIQEELHQFDRLDVWELVDIPL
uniref:Integrase catalytic domain-containing protein n=1 Tax=Tanacetum cinerariifolium TaxID=118510 RepID=A0A6L2MLG2_TANCI|nr:hypothetical protein [Tanacetum cinerariifolium]